MESLDLPAPPPTARRLVRLPDALGRELLTSAKRRWRSLQWKLRRPSAHRSHLLRRAWHRTDPDHQRRAILAMRGLLAVDMPPPIPPAPGTEVALTGELSPGRLAWGEVRLDNVPLDDAIVDALNLDPLAHCRVAIVVRVLDNEARDVETDDRISPR